MDTSSSFLAPLFRLFGQFLMLLYNLTDNYILALILFTLVIKIVLFPLSMKGKKSMMQTQALQGKLQQLQTQYGKDRERYNEEVQKLYEKSGVSPMGGCLWSLLPMPILFGVYAVVRRPLFFMYGLTADHLTAINEVIDKLGVTFSGNSAYMELKVANLMATDSSFLEACKTALGDAAGKLDHLINFNFFGINLAETPKLKFWEGGLSWNNVGLFLIPIVVAVVSIFSSIITQKTNAMSRGEEPKKMDTNTITMLIMMPLMYLWFGFIMPAAMCIYMLTNSVLTMLQELLSARMLRKQFAEIKAKQEEQERLEKEEEKRKRAERAERNRLAAEEAKKNRKKKAVVQPVDKKKTNTNGRVGIRQYALGRDYDPNRYGGVTAYKDPQSIIDEAAIEAALAKKKKPAQEPQEEESQVELNQEQELENGDAASKADDAEE